MTLTTKKCENLNRHYEVNSTGNLTEDKEIAAYGYNSVSVGVYQQRRLRSRWYTHDKKQDAFQLFETC